MSAAARLTLFGVLLAAVFGVFALAGRAMDPDRDSSEPSAESHGAGHGEASNGSVVQRPARELPGLAVASGGYALELARGELPQGRRAALRFRITREGAVVRSFTTEHEKELHLIVLRRDGRGFQHLHPAKSADGTWSTPITLPDAGAYRVFADFTIGTTTRTLGADLTVDGDASYVRLPPPATEARTEAGYEVRLDRPALRAGHETELRFRVRRDGEAVVTEPYLGAGGHLVALRDGDLAYLHTHPAGKGDDPRTVTFGTEFPSPGRYRLYFQFRHGGALHVAEFTQEVTR